MSRSSRRTARPGGHAHTHSVPQPDGSSLGVDTGFHRPQRADRSHPVRLFGELGVKTQNSEMTHVHQVRRLRPGVRRGRASRAGGSSPGRPACCVAAVPADAGGDHALLPAGAGTDSMPVRRPSGGDSNAERTFWTEKSSAPTSLPLHGARGERRLVLRPDDGARLSGAVPLHVPGSPRPAGLKGSPQWRTVKGGSASMLRSVPPGFRSPAQQPRQAIRGHIPVSKCDDRRAAPKTSTPPSSPRTRRRPWACWRSHTGRNRMRSATCPTLSTTRFHRDPAVLPTRKRTGIMELPASLLQGPPGPGPGQL